jgi:hypothetical protein
MNAGIASFGVITATVTAFFLRPRTGQGHQETRTEDLLAVLEDIRARLARIEQERSQAVRTVAGHPELATPGNEQQTTTSWE